MGREGQGAWYVDLLTSVGDLAGVSASAPVAEVRECGTDFTETLKCGAVSWSLVLGKSDLLFFAGLGVFNDGFDRYNLIIEPARFLCFFGALI